MQKPVIQRIKRRSEVCQSLPVTCGRRGNDTGNDLVTVVSLQYAVDCFLKNRKSPHLKPFTFLLLPTAKCRLGMFFTLCSSHFCHNHYLGKWRANRNRLKDAWAYECAHDTNLRPYHRPENQRRYGESRREAQRNLHCSPDSIQGVCPSRATSA